MKNRIEHEDRVASMFPHLVLVLLHLAVLLL